MSDSSFKGNSNFQELFFLAGKDKESYVRLENISEISVLEFVFFAKQNQYKINQFLEFN